MRKSGCGTVGTQSLPPAEDPDSNPVLGIFDRISFTVSCKEKMKIITEKRPEMGHLKNTNN